MVDWAFSLPFKERVDGSSPSSLIKGQVEKPDLFYSGIRIKAKADPAARATDCWVVTAWLKKIVCLKKALLILGVRKLTLPKATMCINLSLEFILLILREDFA